MAGDGAVYVAAEHVAVVVHGGVAAAVVGCAGSGSFFASSVSGGSAFDVDAVVDVVAVNDVANHLHSHNDHDTAAVDAGFDVAVFVDAVASVEIVVVVVAAAAAASVPVVVVVVQTEHQYTVMDVHIAWTHWIYSVSRSEWVHCTPRGPTSSSNEQTLSVAIHRHPVAAADHIHWTNSDRMDHIYHSADWPDCVHIPRD